MDDSGIPPSVSLLLLSVPPSPPSTSALKAAYGPALTSVFRSLANTPNKTAGSSILEVALPCLLSSAWDSSPRSDIYHRSQKLLAQLYKLVSIVCAQEGIDSDDHEGVEVRIILLSYAEGIHFGGEFDDAILKSPPPGPMISLPTLVRCDREWTSHKQWTCVFSLECEEGEFLVRSFRNLRARFLPKAKPLDVVRVPGSVGFIDPNADAFSVTKPENQSDRRHHSVAVGGTFDHLHAGHKLLLTMTAFLLEPPKNARDTSNRILTIGITGDGLLRNKRFAEYMQSWEERCNRVMEFLTGTLDFLPPGQGRIVWSQVSQPAKGITVKLLDLHLEIRCVEISDPFGPTITDESISALVISAETRSGGKAVNEKRREKGWAELEVFEVDVLDAGEDGEDESASVKEDFASKISSTEIRRRKGEKFRTGG
ncbi:hypothetical protein MMC16_006450 [Acarospora aff. strigata]|nr:hypothetical protein [Acarospora aff. strigata]